MILVSASIRDFESQAQLIDETDGGITYLGCPIEDAADPLCAIMKIETTTVGTSSITTKKMAKCTWAQTTLWSDRAAEGTTYKFM